MYDNISLLAPNTNKGEAVKQLERQRSLYDMSCRALMTEVARSMILFVTSATEATTSSTVALLAVSLVNHGSY